MTELKNMMEVFIRTHETESKIFCIILTIVIIIAYSLYSLYIREYREETGGGLTIIADIILAILGMFVIPLLINFIGSNDAVTQRAMEQDHMYDEALQLYEDEEYESARYIWEELVNQEPDNAGFHYEYARTLRYLEEYEGALEHAEIAVDIDPGIAKYQNQAGVANWDLSNYEIALDYFQTASELAPDIAKYYRNIALTLNNLERYEDAKHYYEAAIELFDQSCYHTACGGTNDDESNYFSTFSSHKP